MEFSHIVSLILLGSFLSIIFLVLLADVFVFNEDPGHTKMSYMLVGALTGYVASFINTMYKKK